MSCNIRLPLLISIKLFFLFFLTFDFAFSKGDLTKQQAIELKVFLKGEIGKIHYFEPSVLKFETGKLYILTLTNISDSKHYFSSVGFTNSIYTRKIQLIRNKKKIAEIKGLIREVEIFPNNSLQWWFVPIKTGTFNDLICHVKDEETGNVHSEMGMRGTIIID